MVNKTNAKRVDFLDVFLNGKYFFKFRDWSNAMHRRVLWEKKMYIPSPVEFNDDSYDCRIPESIPNKKERIIKMLVNCLAITDFDNDEIPELANQWYDETPFSNENIEKDFHENTWIPFLKKSVGVLSLAKNYRSDEMWEKYGDKNKGFCLVLDKNAFTSPRTYPYNFCMTGDVKYNDNLSIDLLDWSPEAMFNRFFSKRTKYIFEDEYRCIGLFLDNFLPRYIPLQWVLRAIILGKDIPTKDENEIRVVVKERWGYLPIIKL